VTEFNGIESMTIKLRSRLFHSIFHPKKILVPANIGIGIWGILEKDREGGKNLEQQ
jgi:hypothetical protein